MNFRAFFKIYILLSTFMAVILYNLKNIVLFAENALLSWVSYFFFLLFTLIVYYGAKITAKSSNKQIFSQFFLVATFLKMLVSLTIVLIYYSIIKPESQYFIIPFFFIYICYTVFEVYFMTKLGNTK